MRPLDSPRALAPDRNMVQVCESRHGGFRNTWIGAPRPHQDFHYPMPVCGGRTVSLSKASVRELPGHNACIPPPRLVHNAPTNGSALRPFRRLPLPGQIDTRVTPVSAKQVSMMPMPMMPAASCSASASESWIDLSYACLATSPLGFVAHERRHCEPACQIRDAPGALPS